MIQVRAVMIVIERDGRFLMGKRSLSKRTAPGYWCTVSGHLEPGESEEDAVRREALEEVGLVVEPVARFHTMNTLDGRAKLHWWSTRIVAGEARLMDDENTELRWVTLEEMRGLTPIFLEDVEVFERWLRDR